LLASSKKGKWVVEAFEKLVQAVQKCATLASLKTEPTAEQCLHAVLEGGTGFAVTIISKEAVVHMTALLDLPRLAAERLVNTRTRELVALVLKYLDLIQHGSIDTTELTKTGGDISIAREHFHVTSQLQRVLVDTDKANSFFNNEVVVLFLMLCHLSSGAPEFTPCIRTMSTLLTGSVGSDSSLFLRGLPDEAFVALDSFVADLAAKTKVEKEGAAKGCMQPLFEKCDAAMALATTLPSPDTDPDKFLATMKEKSKKKDQVMQFWEGCYGFALCFEGGFGRVVQTFGVESQCVSCAGECWGHRADPIRYREGLGEGFAQVPGDEGLERGEAGADFDSWLQGTRLDLCHPCDLGQSALGYGI
jgi:hypothetical protein